MAVQPPDLPPRDRSPEDRELSRRSGGGALSPWLLIAGVVLIGVLAFVVFARLG